MNGTALYRARLGKGMTLRDVAAECKRLGVPVDPSNLARAERGLPRGVGPRKIPTLAAVLDLDMAELVPDTKVA